MSIQDFINALPTHKCELILTHNQHKSYYLTVLESIQEKNFGYQLNDWISPEEMQLAITNNECWTLQVYVNTPVGFNLASAYSLDALLTYAKREFT